MASKMNEHDNTVTVSETGPECRAATAPPSTDLEHLKTAFGPALVPLKSDVVTRGQLFFGSASIPLREDLAAESRTLSQSDLAGVLCGGVAGLMALIFTSTETA